MIRFPTYAKTVSLPHLAYKVRFRYFTKAPPNLPNALYGLSYAVFNG